METRIKSSCCLVLSLKVLSRWRWEAEAEDEIGGDTAVGEDRSSLPWSGSRELGPEE
ncbi:hypothetical protein HPP92_014775 [Vanilla planifolia]|uniref:Uncharacterized protein n=1 Tax=Vanilla planifolia TaxID=51239 RepID=A0A835QJY8_VANPL|nr:hypothetical protein HPP92_014775 [Vanilla planifolia]